MKTEMKASNECLYPTDVFLISCGMGCKRITVSDIAYIEAMKDNCIIHMVDGKRLAESRRCHEHRLAERRFKVALRT